MERVSAHPFFPLAQFALSYALILHILSFQKMPFVSDCISNLMSNGIFLELVKQDLDEVLDLLLQNDILDGSVVNQVCSLEKSFHGFFSNSLL